MALGQLAQLRRDGPHALVVHGGHDDERGLEGACRRVERLERRVAAEVGDPPPAGAQREPERDQAKVVLLTREAGEQRERAEAAAPAAGQP